MDIVADSALAFPRALVFLTYRDKLRDLLPHLPNVRGIDVTSRSEEGPVTRIVNVWRGGGEVPPAARAFVSEAMLTWTDRAVWDASAYTCEWNIETHAFTEAVTCRGINRYFEDGEGTRIEMRGNIVIDAKKVKAVPGFLAGKVGRAIEELLAARIAPNFVEVGRGLALYLAEKKTV